MERSVAASKSSETGSLIATAPGGIEEEFTPKNCSCLSDPARTDAPDERRPMLASPITSGWLPCAFEKRTRTLLPPMVTCTISRKVTLLKVAALPSGACVAVLQVPTHLCSSSSARAKDPKSARAATTDHAQRYKCRTSRLPLMSITPEGRSLYQAIGLFRSTKTQSRSRRKCLRALAQEVHD